MSHSKILQHEKSLCNMLYMYIRVHTHHSKLHSIRNVPRDFLVVSKWYFHFLLESTESKNIKEIYSKQDGG